MWVEVLGPVRVRDGDGDVVEIGRPAQRRVLSILALAGGRRVSTDALIDRFWPEEAPETSRAAIQTHVAGLRRVVGDGVIVTEGHGYRLNLDEHRLDADEFNRVAGEVEQAAERRQWQEALDAVAAGMGLWRGDPYVELVDDDYARPDITRLSELRLVLLERRAEALVGLGRAGEALPELEALVVEHPLRERLWEQLMLARYRLGRHTEALRAFGEVSAHLAEVGVEPGDRLRRLEEKVLFHDRSLQGTPHNLATELDSFVGRDVELAEVAELVEANRLVTLTGAGGSGKTRLAVNVARELLEAYPDGVWLVELASLRDQDLIATEIAQAIGVKPEDDALETLCRVLAADTALIVLDNCEHLDDGPSAATSTLLRAIPGLRVVATSRAPLRVPGEVLFEVAGLSLPAAGVAFADIRSSDSILLFEERARQALPSFSLETGTWGPVVEICRRLDGLPLAIELAAARVGVLPVDEIATRLDDRFDLLTTGAVTAPERHQTLEAAIDWSFGLLSEDEQDVLLRLSVFRGGFDLDMAERVLDRTSGAAQVLDLVAKSLVSQYEAPIGPRFRLLETIRDYARVRLEAASIAREVRDQHLDWCVAFAAEVRRARLVEMWDSVADRLGEETDNLLAGRQWAEEHDRPADAGLIAEALSEHWYAVGAMRAAIAAMRHALATCDDLSREASLHGRLSRQLTNVAATDEASAEAALGYRIAGGLPSSPEKVSAIRDFAQFQLHAVTHDPAEGIRLAQEASQESAELGEPHIEIATRADLALALAWNGDTRGGIAEAETVLQLARRTGHERLIGLGYWNLLTVLYMDGAARRERPIEIGEALLAELPDHDVSSAWLPWIMIQAGRFDQVLELHSKHNVQLLEGYSLIALRVERGTVLWMLGRLEEAWDEILDAEKDVVNPRWFHDYYPLRVDIAADLGWLEEARNSADRYLAVEVHATEEIHKIGVLNPVVRAAIDRALTQPEQRDEMIAVAEDAVAATERLIAEFPQKIDGSIAMETPATHLVFARAEVSRATGPDPSLWREAVERADYLYFRVYAQVRLAEALLESGELDAGGVQLREAHAEAARVGAALLVARAEGTAVQHGLTLG